MKRGLGLRRACILTVACLLLLPAVAMSQQRRRTTTTNRRSTRAAATQPSSLSVREGANRVAEKIKLLTRFLYLFGGLSSGFQTADEMARRNEATPAALEQIERRKVDVRSNIRKWREGLDELEIYFRTTPELQRYYINLAGVAASAATAEDEAGANQFDRAGRSLLAVVNRLTDVLVEMR
ncbi:MAG: hypothetical protein WCF57_16655 [Pyrinomonadaceae bacterium]